RRILAFVIFGVIVLVLWETFKLIAGDPLFANGEKFWDPPLSVWLASDINLPHPWVILTRALAPLTSGSSETLGGYLIGQAVFTMREALTGFFIGGVLGILLATVFVHFQLIERAFVPYVVASQTVPIIALAPLIMFFTGHNVTSVIIIATYLCFFPVTIAMLRGLRSPDPRALELMRSYAASRRAILWKVRFPASLPYLFTALKITATASVVGAIVGEGPGGMQEGLGRALMFFSQQYAISPEKLWASIFVTAGLGILFYLAIVGAEQLVLRGRTREVTG
ncbi:MAG: ABC transporter permease, partial [Chloroflexota bacterium]|nr:ABC transporter permease [Chloroflexota bacterium]